MVEHHYGQPTGEVRCTAPGYRGGDSHTAMTPRQRLSRVGNGWASSWCSWASSIASVALPSIKGVPTGNKVRSGRSPGTADRCYDIAPARGVATVAGAVCVRGHALRRELYCLCATVSPGSFSRSHEVIQGLGAFISECSRWRAKLSSTGDISWMKRRHGRCGICPRAGQAIGGSVGATCSW